MNMKKIVEYRKLLNVTKDVTLSELKSIYRTSMKENHPDKFTDEEKKKEEVAVSSSPVSSTGEEKEDLKALSIEELQTLLNDVLEQEDYIRAIAIRDELSNRKK